MIWFESWIFWDQRIIRNTTRAVINPLKAYTSVSTALNQWLWVNAKVKEAVKEDHILKNLLLSFGSTLSMNWLQIRNRRLMVNALIIGEKIFTLNAISLLMGIRLKNLPTNKNSGLPGGWEVLLKYEKLL